MIEIRGDPKKAVFENLDTKETVMLPFELIHVTSPMSVADFVRHIPLANNNAWIDVDKHTLQHVKYANVLSLGDASGLSTSKTGAVIRKQASVMAQNLKTALEGKTLNARYDGYTSCPIVTRYDQIPKETFPIDQSQARWSMWLLNRYGLPLIYWNGMLTGRM